jgi:SAM-dependent methyltransferase
MHKPGNHKEWLLKIGKKLRSVIAPKKRLFMGDLHRVTPISTRFGYDRGGPVDRVYIERFLEANALFIRGRVLEIADNYYTRKFGGDRVSQSEILHVNNENPNATLVGDLTSLPENLYNSFDCIILTQTLHLIYDFKAALASCRRLLKPGGVLLLTVPGITSIDHGEWESLFYYSFTSHLFKKLCAEIYPDDDVTIQNYGNVKTAAAFLYGLGKEEVSKADYDFDDPHYQVIVSCKVCKC